MVSKPVSDQTPEFQIQQEDFPALPGATNPPSSSSGDATCKTPTSLSSGIGDTSLLKDGKYPGDKAPKRGIQTHQDGTVSNIPNGMVNDQFGIVGLLTFIRAAENDPNLVALAPGIDLTTLGLNLNSPENLYSTFQSPWADSPCRPQDIDFHVPAEYLTNIYIRDKLAPIKLNRYGEDLLFYLFYMNGGDVLQLASAAELYSRDWRYHKEERVWITRAPGVDPILKTSTYEQGTYYVFDTKYWRKVHKEIYLEYEKLEDRPNLPPTMVH
nr:CNOT2 [Mytilus galloprovincialis]